MFGKDSKANAAAKSGMRGMHSPMASGGAEEPPVGGVPEAAPELDLNQHVHTDEKGHKHLNLTTLAHHLATGTHPGQA